MNFFKIKAASILCKFSNSPEAKVLRSVIKQTKGNIEVAVINFGKLKINDEDRDRILQDLSKTLNIFKHPQFNYAVVSSN